MNEQVKDTGMVLKIGHLYPTLMSVAADRGNLFSIEKRCQWRGIKTEVDQIFVKQTPDFTKYDYDPFSRWCRPRDGTRLT